MAVHIGKSGPPKSVLDTGWHDLKPGLAFEGRDEIGGFGPVRSRPFCDRKGGEGAPQDENRRRLRSGSALDDVQFLEDASR